MQFRELRERCRRFLGTPAGQRVLGALSLAFTLVLVLYLGLQLSRIGWSQVLGSVPGNPWFYLVFSAFYLSVPLYESLVFRLLWACPLRVSFPALMKKRVYSRHLLDYSGDAYLYLWSRKNINRPSRELLHTIKDNMIISSSSSTAVAIIALVGLLLSGHIVLPARMLQHQATYVIAAAGALAILLLVAKFRHRILWLPQRTIVMLAGIHAARLVSMLLLELLMWTTVDASVPLSSWLSLLSVEVVIARIPFLPNRDLVLFGTGLEIAGAIQVALPLLAGMLLTVSVLEKTLNLCFFGFFSFIKTPGMRTGPVTRADTELLSAQ